MASNQVSVFEKIPYNKMKDIKKIKVPENLVSWDVPCTEYEKQVPFYSDPRYVEDDTKRPKWADHPDVMRPDVRAKILANQKEFGYKINSRGYPLCPLGRRGIEGRQTGEWGANQAVDPVITKNSNKLNVNGKPMMDLLVIRRKDGTLALPGGIKDNVCSKKDDKEYIKTSHVFLPKKEDDVVALARELKEEAFGNDVSYGVSKVDPNDEIQEMFRNNSVLLYSGVVKKEERNTDFSWMVTTAYGVHDKTGKKFEKFVLKPGASETESKWITYDPDNEPELFADHNEYARISYKLNYPGFV